MVAFLGPSIPIPRTSHSLMSANSINKPGGCAKITKVNYAADELNVESIDVKYVLGGGFEKGIDPAIVSPFETLDRGGRKRRGRDFLMERADDVVKKVKHVIRKNTPAGTKTSRNTRTKQPDQSTSPSTPVTPEHPSLKASKVNLVSVPSYVIADRAIEVSPLPEDKTATEPNKATVARRGLFGYNTGSPCAKTKHSVAKPSISKNPVQDSTSHERVKDVSQAHSAAMKESLAVKCGRNHSAKLGAKKATMAERKPKDNRKATKTHLKDVFDYEVRKAKEFLDEVCRAPGSDADFVDTSSKENRLNTSVSHVDELKPTTQ